MNPSKVERCQNTIHNCTCRTKTTLSGAEKNDSSIKQGKSVACHDMPHALDTCNAKHQRTESLASLCVQKHSFKQFMIHTMQSTKGQNHWPLSVCKSIHSSKSNIVTQTNGEMFAPASNNCWRGALCISSTTETRRAKHPPSRIALKSVSSP
jgi:hypothetical protein